MREVGPDTRTCLTAADRVAHEASLSAKDLRAMFAYRIVGFTSRLILRAQPCLKHRFRQCDDQEPHMRVLPAAELRALPAINTRPARNELQLVFLPRNEIELAHQAGHPKAMDHIVG